MLNFRAGNGLAATHHFMNIILLLKMREVCAYLNVGLVKLCFVTLAAR